jgi:diguanylate cyclase (GGDEF)-like protein
MNLVNPADPLLELIVNRLNVGIFTVDRQMQVIQWNRFMELNTGRAAADVLGRNLFDCFPELPRPWLEQKLNSVFILKNFAFVSWKQRPYVFAFPHNRPVTGGIDWMRQDGTFFPVTDAGGEVRAVCATLYDATDVAVSHRQIQETNHKLKNAMSDLERLSNQDALTGIYNRRYLERQLDLEISRVRRYGGDLTLIVFDLDHFKRINDGYGHLAGDAVLRTVAVRVSKAIRDTDIFARYGGEEFCLALPATNVHGAMQVAERVRHMLAREPITHDGVTIAFTASLGVSEMGPSIYKSSDLFELADKALYHSKATGRNRTTLYGGACLPEQSPTLATGTS